MPEGSLGKRVAGRIWVSGGLSGRLAVDWVRFAYFFSSIVIPRERMDSALSNARVISDGRVVMPDNSGEGKSGSSASSVPVRSVAAVRDAVVGTGAGETAATQIMPVSSSAAVRTGAAPLRGLAGARVRTVRGTDEPERADVLALENRARIRDHSLVKALLMFLRIKTKPPVTGFGNMYKRIITERISIVKKISGAKMSKSFRVVLRQKWCFLPLDYVTKDNTM